ncbi:MAG: ABC transporter substrate-binding protein, partial [Caldilineaceae bacterium]|nr:ABC transporter substrate-binding protein [Caldilineaceae bacterium]
MAEAQRVPQTVSRRKFLQLSALTTTGVLVAACGGGGEAPAAEPAAPAAENAAASTANEAATGATGQYNEAPMLAELVQAGSLPPVDERLPTTPKLIEVVEEVGQYGGTWYRVAVGAGDPGIINSRLSYENLVRWSPDGASVVPNVAESYEISDDATTFTIHLREGMKWSDGEPFTADDFAFFYTDVLLNEDLTPSFPKWMRDPVTDEPGVLEKLDDYTISIAFTNPYGLFIQVLAGPAALSFTDYPAHYLKQFHPAYADAAELDAKIAEAGFDSWDQLFGDRRNWRNPEQPHIWPWLPKLVPPDIPTTAERNPYYYKVDEAGNQLPYLDGINFDIVERIDLLNIKAVAGEIDMQFRHISWENFPLYVENAEAGDYQVKQWKLAEGSNYLLLPNYGIADEFLSGLFHDINFRKAISHAIDRSSLRELIYSGFGEPRQATVHPDCPYFKPEWAERYTEYDLTQAGELLDAAGLTEKDADGFRTRPGGEQLTITIEYAPLFGPWRDVTQVISDQLAQIGLRVIPKEEDRSLLEQRWVADELEMAVWTMDRTFTPLIEPQWFVPGITTNICAAPYNTWLNSGGADGIEPPAEIQESYALYDQIKGASPDALPDLATEFFEKSSENLWFIGTVGNLPHVGVVKNNFHNVPEAAISDWLQLTPGNTA